MHPPPSPPMWQLNVVVLQESDTKDLGHTYFKHKSYAIVGAKTPKKLEEQILKVGLNSLKE